MKKGSKFTTQHKEKIGIANKGKVRTSEFKENLRNLLTGKNQEEAIGWKGDKVGYDGLHNWIRKYGSPRQWCEHCGELGYWIISIKGIKRWSIHWANKSGKYKRDLSDWLGLCAKCHKQYDSGYGE